MCGDPTRGRVGSQGHFLGTTILEGGCQTAKCLVWIQVASRQRPHLMTNTSRDAPQRAHSHANPSPYCLDGVFEEYERNGGGFQCLQCCPFENWGITSSLSADLCLTDCGGFSFRLRNRNPSSPYRGDFAPVSSQPLLHYASVSPWHQPFFTPSLFQCCRTALRCARGQGFLLPIVPCTELAAISSAEHHSVTCRRPQHRLDQSLCSDPIIAPRQYSQLRATNGKHGTGLPAVTSGLLTAEVQWRKGPRTIARATSLLSKHL